MSFHKTDWALFAPCSTQILIYFQCTLIHATHLKVEVWQQRPEKERQCTLTGCTNMLPKCRHNHNHTHRNLNKVSKQIDTLNLTTWWNVMCTVVWVFHYLSGRVYDITDSSGGRGSKPITGWLVTSWGIKQIRLESLLLGCMTAKIHKYARGDSIDTLKPDVEPRYQVKFYQLCCPNNHT